MTAALPTWPPSTTAILTTISADPAEGPHSIPISAPVRAGEATILLSLHRTRDTLTRLRIRPQVALLIQAEGIAFTARGTARIAADPMSGAPDYTAVEITVTDVDDHRSAAPTGLSSRTRTLEQLAAIRRRCQVAAHGPGESM